VLAHSKTEEASEAPFAFRCECSVGRAKGQTGIPLWSKRYAAGYDPNLKPAEKVEIISVAKAQAMPSSPVINEPQAPETVLDADSLVALQGCVDSAKAGAQLGSLPAFRELVVKFGKDPVLAAVRSLRLEAATPKVGGA